MTTKCSIHCCKCNELNFLFPHCKTLCMFPCIPPVNGCSRPGASCHVMWWMTNYDLTIHFNQEKWIKDKYTKKQNKWCVCSYFGRWLTAIFLISHLQKVSRINIDGVFISSKSSSCSSSVLFPTNFLSGSVQSVKLIAVRERRWLEMTKSHWGVSHLTLQIGRGRLMSTLRWHQGILLSTANSCQGHSPIWQGPL